MLPIAPTDNHAHYTTVGRDGRIHRGRTTLTQEWQELAGFLALQWRHTTGWQVPPPGQKVIARIWVYWPDDRTRDAGNQIKILADSLKGVLVTDDQWLLPQCQDYAIDRGRPRLEVRLAWKED